MTKNWALSLFFGVALLCIGAAFLMYPMEDVHLVEIDYGRECRQLGKESRPRTTDDSDPNGGEDSLCKIDFTIEEDIDETVYMYYRIENFQQNNRRYVKSRSNYQLMGNELTVEELSECDPIVTNREADQWYSINGTLLDPDAPAFPCGLVAKSLFNDTFTLYQTSLAFSIDEEAEEVSDDDDEESDGRLLQLTEIYE